MKQDNVKKNDMTFLDCCIEKIGHYLSWFYLLIVIISFYEIVSRYIFNSPTDWVHETSIALAAFLMIYAGLFSYGRDKHIRVPILLDRVSMSTRKKLEFFGNLITLIYLFLLAYASFFIAKKSVLSPSGELLLERSGSAWNPPIPGILKISIFILFALFCIQVICKIKSNRC
ncbi:TRAP transporter small permease subunit [Spirabiliibacterium falconis]|uniref:TRAP transporter small permease subunit n=1 Tax=Spirabiliibacterium falconis TaxID=572023 RepID=UPI001AAE0373|nr:TRAP transporter small permease [Spirabiliibacterium falconis]MBE2894729.1 TRAP transporter small permease subunit [Spirabiliibacterium falconis]